ncbi:hypothetical protein DFJ73DRAFT_296039 [Zopfochytrium polystomum]|nr:hypothetical protein DFJ73DRAFT_296039 [Zopfochytrium polystomum]
MASQRRIDDYYSYDANRHQRPNNHLVGDGFATDDGKSPHSWRQSQNTQNRWTRYEQGGAAPFSPSPDRPKGPYPNSYRGSGPWMLSKKTFSNEEGPNWRPRGPPPSRYDPSQPRLSRTGEIQLPMIGTPPQESPVGRRYTSQALAQSLSRPTGLATVTPSETLKTASVRDLLHCPVTRRLLETGRSPVKYGGILLIEVKARVHFLVPGKDHPALVRFVISDCTTRAPIPGGYDTQPYPVRESEGLLCEYWEMDDPFPVRSIGMQTVLACRDAKEELEAIAGIGAGDETEPGLYRISGMLRRIKANCSEDAKAWKDAVAAMNRIFGDPVAHESVAAVPVPDIAAGAGNDEELSSDFVDIKSENTKTAHGSVGSVVQDPLLRGNAKPSLMVSIAEEFVFQCFKLPERMRNVGGSF